MTANSVPTLYEWAGVMLAIYYSPPSAGSSDRDWSEHDDSRPAGHNHAAAAARSR
jgi:hypothetical protein